MADAPPVFAMMPPFEAAALLGNDPIDARAYYDPAFWDIEREAVFKRSWIHVAHACEVPEPGSFVRRELEFARASLLIVRGKDGVIRAFHNACTHRGTQLTDAEAGKASTFSCRYHMWTFGTEGALLSAPDFANFGLEKADCALKQVHVETCGGLVFVNLARQPRQTLREFLGAIAGELDASPIARAVEFDEYCFEIDANWKIYVDNFQENYHLRFIHPKTGAQTIAEENPLGYPTHYGFSGAHRGQVLWKNPAPPPIPPVQLMAMTKAMQAGARDGFPSAKSDFKLFPAMFVLGLGGYTFTHTVYPVSAEKTRGSIRFYWPNKAADASTRFAREYAVAVVRDVHAEDRGVIEAGQKGLSGGAIDTIHFQPHEVLCRHLNQQVQACIADWRKELAGG